MKKISGIFLVLFLILFTAIIKNSTKRIDDQIFVTKENIRGLKKDFENIKLEYDYLSSADKLMEFQQLYFKGELLENDIQNLRIIQKISNNFEIKKLNFFNEQ